MTRQDRSPNLVQRYAVLATVKTRTERRLSIKQTLRLNISEPRRYCGVGWLRGTSAVEPVGHTIVVYATILIEASPDAGSRSGCIMPGLAQPIGQPLARAGVHQQLHALVSTNTGSIRSRPTMRAA